MRVIGIVLIAVGCIGGCASCAEDTTVSTDGGSRVHNIGLMDERRNHLIVSGFAAIAGVLLYGFGELSVRRSPSGLVCPRCNGALSGKPEVCQHCRTELRWPDGGRPVTREQFDEERRRRYEAEERERKRIAEENRRMQEREAQWLAEISEKLRRTTRIVERGCLAIRGAIVGAGLAIDGLLRTAAGDGNEIVYRFFQVLFYIALPAAIVLAEVFAH